jgi:hypothetical protein
METCRFETAAEVCKALGISEIAEMTRRQYTAAHNWKAIGSFPPNTYVVMQAALKARSYAAPAYLWRMIGCDPPPVDAAAAPDASDMCEEAAPS